MKTLVVYYSLEGNTEGAAKKISTALGADLLKLEPIKDISSEGNSKFMVGGMQAIFNIAPKLKTISVDVAKYDRIILGTPIWASKQAPAINTFLKNYNVRNKVTAVFTFAGGGDNDKCISILSKKLPNLKYNVALADRNNKDLAPLNEEKLVSFIKELS